MHKKVLSLLAVSLCLFQSMAFAASAEDQALNEFEDMIEMFREYNKSQEGSAASKKMKQVDLDAKDVHPQAESQEYQSAVRDPFYGYQMFMLVDKTRSAGPGRNRIAGQRAAQTMHLYIRQGNQLKLFKTLAVSTGKEPADNVSDTREGFMRVQSANAEYTSIKYGEAMPFSLWFETEYGTAIHQTTQARCDGKIGSRASAGCIRLCPGDAQFVFDSVTQNYSRSTPIVLLDKRTGKPAMLSGTTWVPRVVRGYPVFVRIINGSTTEKIKEIEGLLANPTENFQKYFQPMSSDVLTMGSI